MALDAARRAGKGGLGSRVCVVSADGGLSLKTYAARCAAQGHAGGAGRRARAGKGGLGSRVCVVSADGGLSLKTYAARCAAQGHAGGAGRRARAGKGGLGSRYVLSALMAVCH